MKLPRDLAGRALVKTLCRDWGYRIVHQEGSHIILDTEEPFHQRSVDAKSVRDRGRWIHRE
jgi:predicted RNA binding protein YcfA (HicA-like mRNA interferase family)